MDKKKLSKFKAKAKENENKRRKINTLKRRIVFSSVIVILCLILMTLSGLLVDKKQTSTTHYEFQSNLSVRELIIKFTQNPPTISGEFAERVKLTTEGAWLNEGESEYFVLIMRDFKQNKIKYTIKKSNLGITGSWSIQLQKTNQLVSMDIKEESNTDNIGYRALQFWGDKNRYTQNLYECIKKAL